MIKTIEITAIKEIEILNAQGKSISFLSLFTNVPVQKGLLMNYRLIKWKGKKKSEKSNAILVLSLFSLNNFIFKDNLIVVPRKAKLFISFDPHFHPHKDCRAYLTYEIV